MSGALCVPEGARLGELGAAEAAQHLCKHLVGWAAELALQAAAALREGKGQGRGGQAVAAGRLHAVETKHVCVALHTHVQAGSRARRRSFPQRKSLLCSPPARLYLFVLGCQGIIADVQLHLRLLIRRELCAVVGGCSGRWGAEGRSYACVAQGGGGRECSAACPHATHAFRSSHPPTWHRM